MADMNITNPYDERIIATVPESTEADVRAAIARAAAAAPVMAQMPAHRKGAILDKAAQIMDAQAAELARMMAQESGKPMKYARGEVARAVETFGFAASEARRLHGETVPMDAAKGGVGKIGYYVRVPVGVIAAITPFNFPLNLVGHKVAPAVAAGCPIVLKPAPATPLTAIRLQEILLEAGLPEGAFEIVLGGADVGEWLTTDPRVNMITFTGSPGVARAISKNVGLRRLTLELGGNAATVVAEDGNLDHAVSRNVMGGTRKGRMLAPTVLENVQESMRVMCMEVFGPVVSLVPYDDFDAALAAVDESPFGLQAGVYTRDLDKALKAVQRLNVGGVIINDVPTFRVDQMPYGGNKDFGVGREGPRFAVEEMTTLKMVVIQTGV